MTDKKFIALAKTLPNGDILDLRFDKGSWATLGEIETLTLTYGEKIEEGFIIHQTEYFSPGEEDLAKMAFQERLESDSPHMSTLHGHSLEYIKKINDIAEDWKADERHRGFQDVLSKEEVEKCIRLKENIFFLSFYKKEYSDKKALTYAVVDNNGLVDILVDRVKNVEMFSAMESIDRMKFTFGGVVNAHSDIDSLKENIFPDTKILTSDFALASWLVDNNYI